MQKVAGLTVVGNGSGIFRATYNGQRDRVVEACRAEMERQKERADHEQEKRFELLGEKLEMMRRQMMRKRGPVWRLIRKIETAWAMLWAITHCWPEMGENAGLWERIDPNGKNDH